ncbi:MAG: hypothetical protein FWD47_13380 [Treponema sp.]|nr:hypothetical protein [Treponema sp.]
MNKKYMMNKYFVIKTITVILFLLVFINNVSAQSIRTGLYMPTNGNNIAIRFISGLTQVTPRENRHSGRIQISTKDNPEIILGTGQYNIIGNRLTIIFNQIDNPVFRNLSGRTFLYTVNNQESFSGNGEQWVRLNN